MSEEIAYIAGLFDGEGCVSVYHEKTTKYRLARIQASLSNTNLPIVEYLKDCFGGYVKTRILPSGKLCKSWSVSCRKAAEVLTQLIPYLKIKRGQAELALRIFALTNRERRSRGRNDKGQFQRLPEEELCKVAELTKEVKQLNGGIKRY